jgi:hypothetical protein
MGKITDTAPDLGMLIVIPALDPAGKNLAQLYDIEVVEAKNVQLAAEEIEKTLRRKVKSVNSLL